MHFANFYENKAEQTLKNLNIIKFVLFLFSELKISFSQESFVFP